ncbi:MAG: [FeFe] hydrogenase H-cluster maturation GTPase HydF, partial [Ignavibacteria bacterium]|nr:[FeFe] hydrogenase H-cluster maturation GTPase HydF [Ignavibacteria bacterium]
MLTTPKSLRLQIAIFGRTNVGKSSFLNFISNQDVSIVSPIPGTTTDIVEKPIELLPIGPLNFIDTAGIDDTSVLSEQRIKRTRQILDRADVCIFVLEANLWTNFEEEIVSEIKKRQLPIIFVINKIDIAKPSEEFISLLKNHSQNILQISALQKEKYDEYLNLFKNVLKNVTDKLTEGEITILGDIVPKNGFAIFIIPIDSQAPKGRLILPQVQAIRDILDNSASVLVLKETEYSYFLNKINLKPDLVVCDSQVVHKMVSETPPDIKCTTFSILFSRFKGDLMEEVCGAAKSETLQEGDNVLIAEACSHHPTLEDIGRVKIPQWLQFYLGKKLNFDISVGRDFPDDLTKYKLIIHCGACMLTRREKLNRI